MAGASLLTLLDDIASVLDDIAVMSKVAAKKTAGVLGDDLALNAEQVMGVAAERELPVVWAVAKGSLRNKAILVPLALLLSAFIPVSITYLLVLGGLYLSFEGAEKIIEKLMHHHESRSDNEVQEQMPDLDEITSGEYETRKVKGAIRTDFILSAEIIVLALGVVQEHHEPLVSQILILIIVAFSMTIGVYGVVAGIVKLDDVGMFLEKRSGGKGCVHFIGHKMIAFAPKLMKLLTVIGTAAMFFVGGGIIVHKIPLIFHHVDFFVEHQMAFLYAMVEPISAGLSHQLESVMLYLVDGIIGLIVGVVLVGMVSMLNRLRTV